MTTRVSDALNTLHGCMLQSQRRVHYDWRLTRGKAGYLIKAINSETKYLARTGLDYMYSISNYGVTVDSTTNCVDITT